MRGSRPVLGEAEGEIPSAYLPLITMVFFWLLKEMILRQFCCSFTTSVCGNFARHLLTSSDSDSIYSLFRALEDDYHLAVEKSI